VLTSLCFVEEWWKVFVGATERYSYTEAGFIYAARWLDMIGRLPWALAHIEIAGRVGWLTRML
jgi:hypothetical protein